MVFSKETLAIFRNFASIQPSLYLKAGKDQRFVALADSKQVMAETTLPENLPVDFPIYDMNDFLGMMNIFQNPELTFDEKFVTISDTGNNNNVKYFAASSSLVKEPPSNIKFKDPEIAFDLSQAAFDSIKKASSILKTSDITIVGEDAKLKIVVGDANNPTANRYESNIDHTDLSFQVFFKIEHLKLFPGDYKIYISSKKISKFVTKNIAYYIAIDAKSTFDF